ncbi:MAG: dihydrofolate reductase [Atopobiaceae bacterium]|nr:dihydrofolate reductase [Atopobiaceae bacterium]
MNAIVSVCEDWGIGLRGRLLVPNTGDMRRFRELTSAGEGVVPVVVMGRKTAESFPGGRPLPKRRNIVLTRNPAWQREGFEVVHSVQELQELLGQGSAYGEDAREDAPVWLIGGEVVYRLLLPLCERVYVTKNDCIREADAFFPDLDADPEWEIESMEPGGTTEEGVEYRFVTYALVEPAAEDDPQR